MKFEINIDPKISLGYPHRPDDTPEESEIKYVSAVKAGRCWNGFHNDRGSIVHAVPPQIHNGYWGDSSACGTKPGNRSYGWDTTDKEINCPKCLKKLSNA